MVIDKEEIIQCLDATLDPFAYHPEDDGIVIPDVWHIMYIKKKHPLRVRNLCALVSLPENIHTNDMARRVFSYIRKRILKQYGDAFLWKELEIIFIVLAHDDAFKALKTHEGKAVDQSGFTMSSMLGSFFINHETLECFGRSTWGIYFSSDHFKVVSDSLTQWCRDKKTTQNTKQNT